MNRGRVTFERQAKFISDIVSMTAYMQCTGVLLGQTKKRVLLKHGTRAAGSYSKQIISGVCFEETISDSNKAS